MEGVDAWAEVDRETGVLEVVVAAVVACFAQFPKK